MQIPTLTQCVHAAGAGVRIAFVTLVYVVALPVLFIIGGVSACGVWIAAWKHHALRH